MGGDSLGTGTAGRRAISDAVAVLIMVSVTFSVILLIGLFVLGHSP